MVVKTILLSITWLPALIEYAVNYIRYDLLHETTPLEKYNFHLADEAASYLFSGEKLPLQKLLDAEKDFEAYRATTAKRVENSYFARLLYSEKDKELLQPISFLPEFFDGITYEIDFSKDVNKQLENLKKSGGLSDPSIIVNYLYWRNVDAFSYIEKLSLLKKSIDEKFSTLSQLESLDKIFKEYEKEIESMDISSISEDHGKKLRSLLLSNESIAQRNKIYPEIVNYYIDQHKILLEKALQNLQKLEIKDRIETLAENTQALPNNKRISLIKGLLLRQSSMFGTLFEDQVFESADPTSIAHDLREKFEDNLSSHVDNLLALIPEKKITDIKEKSFKIEGTLPGILEAEFARSDKKSKDILRDIQVDMGRADYVWNEQELLPEELKSEEILKKIKKETGYRHSNSKLWQIMETYHQGALSLLSSVAIHILHQDPTIVWGGENAFSKPMQDLMPKPRFEATFNEEKKEVQATATWLITDMERKKVYKKMVFSICYDFKSDQTRFSIESSKAQI